MSKTTRGDALALAVSRVLSWELATSVRFELSRALEEYRASEPKGERVRLAVWRDPKSGVVDAADNYDPDDGVWDECPRPDCYVEFTLPPRVDPVVVEGEIDG